MHYLGQSNKTADVNKYKYSGYGIAFDRISSFSFPGGRYGQNVILFGVDMNSSIHLTVCSYHVTYAFQSESTLYSCLNVKELLAQSRREI